MVDHRGGTDLGGKDTGGWTLISVALLRFTGLMRFNSFSFHLKSCVDVQEPGLLLLFLFDA